jgi:hypothetical protein
MDPMMDLVIVSHSPTRRGNPHLCRQPGAAQRPVPADFFGQIPEQMPVYGLQAVIR